MGGTKADRRKTGVDVGEIVVVVGHMEVAGIFVGVAIRVADQRALPVIVELGPRDGHIVTGVCDVQQTIVGVLVASETDSGEVAVVDPDVGRDLQLDQILALGSNRELQVLQDNIGLLLDSEPTVGETGVGTYTNDGGVAQNIQDPTAVENTRDLDDSTGGNGTRQSRAGSDRGATTAAATGGASSVSNKRVVRRRTSAGGSG